MPSVTALPSELPDGYLAFLEDFKARVSAVQLRAVLSASRGQPQAGWGAKVSKFNDPKERLGYAAASVDKHEKGWF